MSLATWWRGDTLPKLSPLADFAVTTTDNRAIIHQVTNLAPSEIERRLAGGHRPYLGLIGGKPVAYGWLATRQADIGELKLTFRLPAQHRYLWDFATLPAWRGRGIYPHLLQAILGHATSQAGYFWIIHAPENGPSRSGIRKAGFTSVGQLSLDRTGQVALDGVGEWERVRAAVALFHVPLAHAALSPCWHCGGADYPALPGKAGCACYSSAWLPLELGTGGCSCAAA
jgi:GNAT superfamily N-acetyltransferase